MANAAQHATIGALTGGGIYLLMCHRGKRRQELGEFLLCVLIGIATASLPDALEPALDPNHRQFAHSATLAVILVKIALVQCSDEQWDEFLKIALASATAGYISHLLADGCTPRGLPLLGR